MADTPTPTTNDVPLDLEASGLTGRTLMTGVGLAAEGVAVLKVAGTELIDAVDVTTVRALDLTDELVTELAGPFTDLVRAPVSVVRAAQQAATTGTRRLLAVA